MVSSEELLCTLKSVKDTVEESAQCQYSEALLNTLYHGYD